VGGSGTGNIVVTPVYIRGIDLRNFREKSRDVKRVRSVWSQRRTGGRTEDVMTCDSLGTKDCMMAC
jgi:hypothetical protein